MRRFIVPLLLALVVVALIRPVKGQNQPNNPQLALWLDLKRDLQGPNGRKYFESNLKGISVPNETNGVRTLKGTVISGKPAKRPSELVLAMSDGHTPEVTVTLRDSRQNLSPLLKSIAAGTEIEFVGIPVSFTQNPFMLIFEVKVENGPSGSNPQILTRGSPKPK
jgi:hypothetical protein